MGGGRREKEGGKEVGSKKEVGDEGIDVASMNVFEKRTQWRGGGGETDQWRGGSAGEEEGEGGDEGAVGGGDREKSEERPIIPDPVTTDPSLPTTMVQIRLADGSR